MYNATGEPPLEMNGTADAASSFELPLSLDAALPYLNPWNLSVVHWLVGFVLTMMSGTALAYMHFSGAGLSLPEDANRCFVLPLPSDHSSFW